MLYVDDFLIATYDNTTMTNFKNYLMAKFKMVDLNEIKLFLGIRIERTEKSISLDQSFYLKTALSNFNMSECKPVNSPLPTKLNYSALNSEIYYDAPCRNLIGCLMYVMLCTRPDLCISINCWLR